MGMSIWQLLIILVIVLVLFGAKRLRNIGSDLGSAVKGFKESMKSESDETTTVEAKDGKIIEGETSKKKDKV